MREVESQEYEEDVDEIEDEHLDPKVRHGPARSSEIRSKGEHPFAAFAQCMNCFVQRGVRREQRMPTLLEQSVQVEDPARGPTASMHSQRRRRQGRAICSLIWPES